MSERLNLACDDKQNIHKVGAQDLLIGKAVKYAAETLKDDQPTSQTYFLTTAMLLNFSRSMSLWSLAMPFGATFS